MNLLDKILLNKKKEISYKEKFYPVEKLKKNILFERTSVSLSENLKKSNTGIIAEFKSKSPSKGVINNTSSLEEVINGYRYSGVCGVSVLTDYQFFSGSNDHVKKSRFLIQDTLPILRKDFIISEYQIIESKCIGSDVILLIAEILSKEEIEIFSKLAKNIGLEVILEIHSESELDKITKNINIIGINNRDLRNFIVRKNNCLDLSSKIPNNYIKIAESGINDVNFILKLRKHGFKGFLIGEYFMKNKNPGKFCKNFIKLLLK
ncbi:indole-3-glycerol phosphate synthase TrpC [Blattabacterium cuenoti]|uniref:indole-3-glycerol phosphate synthase TrpC n=1 Tax=Blattabacterium cuenoti TaxID=1653831 RepID=UPI00163C69DE|nr:indole-3-glycerol phosphate synthase TrpC [Blattabacterium cuenoti]